MSRFKGKVALVTGGASGIGPAIAARLLTEGASVVLVDLNAEALELAAKEAGDRVATLVADVTSEADVEAAVAAAVERFGRLDLCFNVAGGARFGTLTDISEEDWSFTIDLVLKGTFLCTRHAPCARAGAGAPS